MNAISSERKAIGGVLILLLDVSKSYVDENASV
jgi:hypothetical protein